MTHEEAGPILPASDREAPMAPSPDPAALRLGGALLDLGRGTLSREGRDVPLRAKSFRLLCELARQAGRVVAKGDLLDAVWPDVVVTEDSLTQAVRDVRRALGDDGHRVLRTVARRGFMLCPEGAAAASDPRARPRVAVLPLRDRTGDPGLRPVLDGLVEEVTTGLARFRALQVIARHSAFAAGTGEGSSLAEVGAMLGADHVVDGTARLREGRLVLTVALSDVATGEMVWGDGFDCEGTGWLSLQDLIPRRIVQRLLNGVEEATVRGAQRRGTESLTAFERLARGRAFFRSFEEGADARARAEFAAALAIDPGFGLAHSYHACADTGIHGYGAAPREVQQRGKAQAMRGLELAPDESACHRILSMFHVALGEWDAAEGAARRAVALNPCNADALHDMGFVAMVRGRGADCLEWLERAKEIDPLWPAYYDATLSAALFGLGRYEESAASLQRLPRLSARQQMRLAATFALQGDRDGARRHAALARALMPGADFAAIARGAWAGERPEQVERLVGGIERALGMLGEG